jgi:hypothetical protein
LASGADNWRQMKAAYAVMGPAGRLAAVAGAACVVIVALALWAFGRSIIIANPPAAATSTKQDELAKAHNAAFNNYIAQVSGRSLFIKPGAPTPPAPPPPPRGPDGPTEPEKPKSYEGSPIVGMILDTVWFADGKKLTVGDPPQDDTEVLEVLAPWDAVLRWKGEKFTVSLFQRDQVVMKPPPKTDDSQDLDPLVTAAKTDSKSDTAKPAPANPDASKLVVVKPAPKPDNPPKPPEPKSDASPDATPAAAPPPGDSSPDSDSKPQGTETP